MGCGEVIAVVSGLICVVLLVRRSMWSWPVGLVQVSLFTWIFWEARLYSDVVLHLVYVVLQLAGWVNWLRGNRDAEQGEKPVQVLSSRGLLVTLSATAGGTAVLAFVMIPLGAALPVADAFTTSASLAAQWLLVRKILQNWLFWIAVDVVAIPVYLLRGLHLTAGLYGVFLILAILGYLSWRRHLATQADRDAAPSSASSSRRTGGTSTSSTSPAPTASG